MGFSSPYGFFFWSKKVEIMQEVLLFIYISWRTSQKSRKLRAVSTVNGIAWACWQGLSFFVKHRTLEIIARKKLEFF